jgi:hypothetical protein
MYHIIGNIMLWIVGGALVLDFVFAVWFLWLCHKLRSSCPQPPMCAESNCSYADNCTGPDGCQHYVPHEPIHPTDSIPYELHRVIHPKPPQEVGKP